MLNTWMRLQVATRILFDVNFTPKYQIINSGDMVTFNATTNYGRNAFGQQPSANWIRDNSGNVTGPDIGTGGYSIPGSFPLTVGPFVNITGVAQLVNFSFVSAAFFNAAQDQYTAGPDNNLIVIVRAP
jgi:hypothetical protein